MVLETPTHAWQSQARLQGKDPKPATPVAPQKVVVDQQAISSGKRSET